MKILMGVREKIAVEFGLTSYKVCSTNVLKAMAVQR
jgi:hypothetical protein